MSEKNKEKNQKNSREKSGWNKVKDDTKQGIFAILFFVLAAIFLLASVGKAGIVGDEIYKFLSILLGIGYFLIPILFILLCISFIKAEEREFNKVKVFGGLLFFISGLGLIDLLTKLLWVPEGGQVGWAISTPLLRLFGSVASIIILIALVIISCLILFEAKFSTKTLMFWKKFKGDALEEKAVVKNLKVENAPVEVAEAIEAEPKKIKAKKIEDEDFKIARFSLNSKYVPPPLSLLEQDSGKIVSGDIKENANIIKRTLANFGIDVEMDEVSIGPSVTRYALKPAEGMKISKILGLQNDLSLALAAHPIRIEAPIPGKSLVGIEIPNATKSLIGLGSLIGSEEFQTSDKPLLVSLGKGISGKFTFANLAKMPHVLVAGATGSGKSVTIHELITSLLYRNSPENLRFIMIDPKRVELTLYNKA